MGFMPLASGFAQLPLLLVLKRVPLRTVLLTTCPYPYPYPYPYPNPNPNTNPNPNQVLLTFCVVLCASQVL